LPTSPAATTSAWRRFLGSQLNRTQPLAQTAGTAFACSLKSWQSDRGEGAMKLSAIHIQNFRSVKNARIEDIGNFNVLIAKNNSGKSNILSATHAFFQILSNGSLVSSQPVIGNLSDFTQRLPTNTISLSAHFIPDLDSRTGFRRAEWQKY
jgi:hypothetical protein